MCRLYGQRSAATAGAAEPLCVSHNALRFQSHVHPHGWGVGWWRAGRPQVERGVLPAHADQAFCDASHRARSRVVLAHVRDASVGAVTERNTHPFAHGPWLFAHNGTVARFRRSARVRAALEAEIAPSLRRNLHGETDSERCFYLFLSRLGRSWRRATLAEVRRALAETTRIVSGLADPGAARPSSLNFLVSDGRLLAAARRGRTLHLLRQPGPSGRVVIASEPIGKGPWREVPDGGFVGVDPRGRLVEGALLPPRP
ncbi:MAG: class II glutamine amidotransferase [Deltaproteobacteria bacterium]|nr:class II glutamine amidotransferase [Deltaproteobacteria bacterium]